LSMGAEMRGCRAAVWFIRGWFTRGWAEAAERVRAEAATAMSVFVERRVLSVRIIDTFGGYRWGGRLMEK
jgi:hypothetical protein